MTIAANASEAWEGEPVAGERRRASAGACGVYPTLADAPGLRVAPTRAVGGHGPCPGDRGAATNGGRIVQLATPREIYEAPIDPFVAEFIGTSSFFRGTVAADASIGSLVDTVLSGGETL